MIDDFGKSMNLKIFFINILTKIMKSSFYNPKCSYQLFMLRYDDIFKNKKTTLSQKIWAQKRGFLSENISYLGLTDDNYTNYLSDFDYFQLHPINGAYSRWIDGKVTIKFILQPFSEFLPKYYYHIYDNEVLKLMDCPEGLDSGIQGIIDLLKTTRFLAAKPVSGTLGEGFYKLAYDGQDYLLNDKSTSEPEIIGLINSWMQTENSERS